MAKLYLFCGKIASGKSTFANTLMAQDNHIILREDKWLSTLFPNEITSPQEFEIKSNRLEEAIFEHLVQLLKTNINVVLDFHANTKLRRDWLMKIIKTSNCENELHFFDLPDDLCKQRLRKRNATGKHEYQASDDMYDMFAKHFSPPSNDEGFNIVRHTE